MLWSNWLIQQRFLALPMTIDNTLILIEHVNNVCEAAHYHVIDLSHIRECVSEYISNSIAILLVGARLDYSKIIFHGTSHNINKLQRVQKTLARVVEECGK